MDPMAVPFSIPGHADREFKPSLPFRCSSRRPSGLGWSLKRGMPPKWPVNNGGTWCSRLSFFSGVAYFQTSPFIISYNIITFIQWDWDNYHKMTFFQVSELLCCNLYVDLSPDCDLILSKPISSGSTLIHSMTDCRTTERNIYIYCSRGKCFCGGALCNNSK